MISTSPATSGFACAALSPVAAPHDIPFPPTGETALMGRPARATVLDLYGESQTTTPVRDRWPVCPVSGDFLMRHLRTGEVTRGRCLDSSCYACVWPVALRVGGAIGLARPDRLITLTHVGRTWATIQSRMTYFRRVLTRRDLPLEYAWHVEPDPDPASPEHHVHLWSHGADPSRGDIAAAAIAASMGPVCDVRSVEVPTDGRIPTLAYGMKTCEPPHGLMSQLWPEAERYLAANGGRLVHPTRGFWRDLLGHPVNRMREAIRLARQAQGFGNWVPAT
ncbi:hypothetical protein DFJ68_2675 [Terracoccus luteus]|uniref:Replication initiator protein n=1 Tax=Terracoccus luteus TaxID=53356 RepID=A0A495XX97_9MICO|nr:hypothetical protein DFJ68_2675 [Terracoccus luteus]